MRHNCKARHMCQKVLKHKLDIDVQKYFNVAREATTESRLRLLHFKFVDNMYPSNILLKKMGEKETNRCSACQDTNYTEHTFYQCHKLNAFWRHVKQFILTETNTYINFNEQAALFGLSGKEPHTKDKLNFILLIARLSTSKFKHGKI